MAGYAATARIGRVRTVVRTAPGTPRREDPRSVPRRPGATPRDDAPAVAEELVGRPLDAVLRERWERVRDGWSQATFFLFDPDSWR